jgi:2-keto-4-pentenoate hydratase
VFFDFGGLVPHYFDSYRGYYDHMAITFTGESAAEVRQLVAKLKAADGEVFSGYKGGDYRMNRSSPVWVANHGECDGTAIVGLLVESHRVTILTEYKP